MVNKYEIVLVYDPDLDEEGVRAQLDKVSEQLKAHQGSVLREELLGRQQLSYPMKKKTSGVYVILVAEAQPAFVAEFTRQMRITDEVLRFSCVRKDKFAPDFVKREERSRDSKGRSRDDRSTKGGSDRRAESRDKDKDKDKDKGAKGKSSEDGSTSAEAAAG